MSRRFLLILGAALWAMPLAAQTLSLDLGEGGGNAGRLIQLFMLMTILSLAPSLLMMATSFTRIAIVLSFLRSALGLQQTPPNAVLLGLSIFLTGFIMAPTFEEAYQTAVQPLIEERISEEEAARLGLAPFRKFMLTQVREKDLGLFMDISKTSPDTQAEALPAHVIVPAFMIGELRKAFEVGFLIYIPFLIIDMVVASILMAMGMMMVPPVMVALPFKLIFFVLVDGWHMIVGSLIQSFQP